MSTNHGFLSSTAFALLLVFFNLNTICLASQVDQGVGRYQSTPICEASDAHSCWYVSPTGSNNNDGSFSTPFKDVQYAIDNMQGGDIIYLREGMTPIPSQFWECRPGMSLEKMT